MISFQTQQPTINYTLVAKTQQGNDPVGYDINSFYQANTAISSTYPVTYDSLVDNSSCQCITQDVILNHRNFKTRDKVLSSASFISQETINPQSTRYKGVNVCRSIDGSWPLHSFTVTGTDNSDNPIGTAGFLSSFEPNNDQLWTLPGLEVAENITLPNGHQSFETQQNIKEKPHFYLSVIESEASLMMFNSHAYSNETRYASKANHLFEKSSSIYGVIEVKSSHQKESGLYNESINVNANENKPNIDYIYFSEIKPDWSYDYSAVKGYPMAIITIDYLAFDPVSGALIPAKWTTYGPHTGLLANSAPLTGYENIISADTRFIGTETKLIKSHHTSDYNNYIQYYQNVMSNNFSANLETYDIVIRK